VVVDQDMLRHLLLDAEVEELEVIELLVLAQRLYKAQILLRAKELMTLL
jgi:hypothetical protein